MNNWLEFVLRHRLWVIVGALLLTVPAFYFVTTLESEEIYASWYAPDDPSYRFYQEFQRRFANDMFFVVVFKDDPLFTAENLGLVNTLTSRLEALPYVRQVTSLTNVEYLYGQGDRLIVESLVEDLDTLNEAKLAEIRERALSKPIYRGGIISDDGTTTAILGELERVEAMTEERALISRVQAILRETEERTGKRFYLGGYPVLDVAVMQASEQDVRKFIPLSIGLIFIVLWAIFRRVRPAALAFVAVLLALAWTFGLYAGVGNKYSMMMSILPAILIAIGIADSVHILIHYYEELSQGRAQGEALRLTVRRMFRPCLFTTLTTGAGFISFLGSDIPIVRMTGLYAAIGIAFAFVLTVLVLPAVLSYVRAPKRAARGQTGSGLVALLDRLGRWTVSHPKPILVGMALLVITGAIGTMRVTPEASSLQLLRDGHPLQRDYAFIEENLTGLSNLEIIVEGERDALRSPEVLEKLERLSAFALGQEGVRKTLSLAEYVKEINQALHGGDPRFYAIPPTSREIAQSLLLYEFSGGRELRDYVSGDYSAGRLTMLFNSMTSGQSTALENRIVDYAQNELGLPIKTTGTIELLKEMMNKVAFSQIKSLSIALGLITLLMILLLRSVKLGLISLIPNALPILLMFGVMGYAGIPLDAATSIVAGLALGIAVDDTIHYLARFRRELSATGAYREALRRATHTVGRAIVSTSVILFAGFIVLVLGTFKGTIYTGILVGTAMAFALVGDLVLLPGLLLLLKPIPVGLAEDRPQVAEALPHDAPIELPYSSDRFTSGHQP